MAGKEETDLGQAPVSIEVLAWAIIAGISGLPISVQFNGLTGYLKTRICRIIINWVGISHSKIVQSKRDIKSLVKDSGDIWLAIFTDVHLYSQAEWVLETTFGKKDSSRRIGPVLLLLDSESPDDPTGPLLKVHCAPHELKNLGDWLKRPSGLPVIPKIHPDIMVCFDPRNDVHQTWPEPTQYGVELGIFQSILVGGTLSDDKSPESYSKGISRETYSKVRQTLQSPLFQPPGCVFSPRLTFMVNRGNMYLNMIAEKSSNLKTKFESDLLENDGLITQRGMVDLGNPKSSIAKGLVEFLMNDQNRGLEKFIDCGLTVKLSGDTWPSDDPEVCCKLLLPWSSKQVRTEFTRACDSKILTATRFAANKPYRYRLPESFTKASSSFKNLPDPDRLKFPFGTIEIPALVGPSQAQGPGQAEVVLE